MNRSGNSHWLQQFSGHFVAYFEGVGLGIFPRKKSKNTYRKIKNISKTLENKQRAI